MACIFMQSNRTRAENHKFYDNLYEKFSSFCDSGNIILNGDFNTRTQILQDYIAVDNNSKTNISAIYLNFTKMTWYAKKQFR